MAEPPAWLIQLLEAQAKQNATSQEKLIEALTLKTQQQEFALTSACMKGKSTGEVLQLLDRLLSRKYDGAIHEQDKHARVMLACIRTIVDEDLRLHLDHSAVRTREDLKTALELWESSHGGFI